MLASLWVGTAWLLRWQDIAMQAQHASRYAAFAASRDADAQPLEDIRHGYFAGSAHMWRDRRGASLLSSGRSEVSLQLARGQALGAAAQPGGEHPDAGDLRQGWRIEDAGVVTARVGVAAGSPAPAGAPSVSGLAQYDAWRPNIRRHAAILVGAGHASSDAQAQLRVAGSGLGWLDPADRSYALGRQVQAWAGGLDRPWGRTAPVFDWLGPWAGRVPQQHLRPAAGARHTPAVQGMQGAQDAPVAPVAPAALGTLATQAARGIQDSSGGGHVHD
ncbi:hypothetical protein [Candidimonas nitroreducens]|uniref:Uncharacterized protein n=1 Tax=Candidimonas nitroreducens TaxID=683354 RepID=A0A225M671_9BURK|nr:hypothetical protein [Candidimonas nitroreducens]OWT54459.1 hypothetical protein CEY11_22285 [Candidimonas nitroreducens]